MSDKNRLEAERIVREWREGRTPIKYDSPNTDRALVSSIELTLDDATSITCSSKIRDFIISMSDTMIDWSAVLLSLEGEVGDE